MTAPTNVRAGRVTALLVALQAAQGTPVSDFTQANAGRLWTSRVQDDVAPSKSDAGGWMSEPQLETGGRYSESRALAGAFVCKATPYALEWLLRSNWGAYSAGAWTLATVVNEWLTLGWVEDVFGGSGSYLHRVYDAWVHKLVLRAGAFDPLSLEVQWAAERDSAPQDLASLVGITLPVDPMPPIDVNVFPGRLVKLFRDPTGTNEEISLAGIEISIDQGLVGGWDQARQVGQVVKGGFPGPRVEIRFEAHVSNETWALISAARAGTKQRYRLTAECQLPAKTFQMDFYEVDFQVEPIGHDGTQYTRFRAVGQAHRDDSGNFVSLSIF